MFPQALCLGASWSPDLVEAVAATIRKQLLAVGARHSLAPVLDVARDPSWGRMVETFGESPVLCGLLGTAYLRGMQGEDLAHGVLPPVSTSLLTPRPKAGATTGRSTSAPGSYARYMPSPLLLQ